MATSKLSSKAAKLDFSNLPGALPSRAGEAIPGLALPNTTAPAPVAPSAPLAGPKTAPGALMAFANDARSSLLKENEELRAAAAEAEGLRSQLDEALVDLQQWEGAKAARWLDPKLVVRSRYANRDPRSFLGVDFEQLKAEIANAGGNVQPIKVRQVAAEGGAERFELVYGHRRHQACLELGLPVLAMVDNLDDQALFVEMDRENRTRKDLSAWEQGKMYQRALDEGLFPSNRKLAEAVGVDLGNLGKALSLARLPAEVVGAFASPLDLQFRWSKLLNDALNTDREGVLRRAAALSHDRGALSGKEVLQRLLQDPVDLRGNGALYRTTPSRSWAIELAGRGVATVQQSAEGDLRIDISGRAVEQRDVEALVQAVRLFVGEEAVLK
ncbi:ParB/RepB/Spo0J family partition protein [Ideonella livida]|uniref:ParB/RepB/Spo0J family partition protein n=1 Tax=Ideonella livida TaxID=2707176 RepID=A0A7C9TIG7_9BURK|nr:ParB/RepB/Spo0J family partition protein [Ideonella livida]NDY90263.1 ParB/RepB/Spo0J family partition protein [Ideonella livida]